MRKLTETCTALFHPTQMGVGMPRGAEIGVHCLRQYLAHTSDQDKVVLKVDFANAFNSLRRDKILAKVQEHVPMLYPMVWQSYANPTNLYFNEEDIVRSAEGVQQGDPIGAFLFLMFH